MDQTNRIALDGAAIQEMREANETRAAFCRFLASLYLYELTDEQIEAFAHIEIAGDGTAIDEGLRAIKEYAAEKGIKCYISLEEKMACGIGACLACVCKSKEIDAHSLVHNKRVCKDGPVFLSTEVEL